MYFLQNSAGAIAGPFDSFLALRGLKTLALRMRAHSDGALKIARWLNEHPAVSKVIYPGLEAHPQHALAMDQMNGMGGGIISLEIAAGADAARRVLEQTKLLFFLLRKKKRKHYHSVCLVLLTSL